MNKQQFLIQLEKELTPLPEDIKNKTMKYYKDCFEGVDSISEQAIILKLGNPNDIAKKLVKQHEKNVKINSLPENKRNFWQFINNVQTIGIIQTLKGYKFNFKNIILAFIALLLIIFLALPLLFNASAFIFAVFCGIFGIFAVIICIPIVMFAFGVGLVFVSLFRLWQPVSAGLSLILGIFLIILSIFLSKLIYKLIKKYFPIITKKIKTKFKIKQSDDEIQNNIATKP